MAQLRPRQQFQANDENAKAFREVIKHPMMQSALLHALAEFSITMNPDAGMLAGANRFIDIFTSIADLDASRPNFPDKAAELYSPKPVVLKPKK